MSILPPPLSFRDCYVNGKIDVNRWFALRVKRSLANSGTGDDVVRGTGDDMAEIVLVEVVNRLYCRFKV